MYKSIMKEVAKEQMELLKSICKELGAEDRIDELTEKYIDSKKTPSKKQKPKSAYIFFCQNNREEAKNKADSPKEVMTILGKMWKECPAEDRAAYEEMAAEDKIRLLNKK